MADTIRGTIEQAGHSIAEGAKTVGQKVSEGVGQAAEWVKEKTGLGHHEPIDRAAIKPHMDVITSCGHKVGSVDHLEGGAIKMALRDSPDGLHHYIPVGWVAKVDDRVHLSKNMADTRSGWKPTAAACATAG